MNIAVGFGCLVTMAVLEEILGLPEPQVQSPSRVTENQKICSSPFKLQGNECFFIHENISETLNWDESRQRCLSMGSDLAQPHDMVAFVNYIKEDYPNNNYHIWLGATKITVEDQWKWVSGDSVPADMWKPWNNGLEPSGDGNCMQLYKRGPGNLFMNDANCDNSIHFACEIALPTPRVCVGEAIAVGSQCLTFSGDNDKLSWNNATAACKRNGGRLAILEHPEDVADYVAKTYTRGTVIWVGASDAEIEGTWFWTDGEPLGDLFPWYRGEPNGGNNENCLIVLGGFGFVDYGCSRPRQYICEDEPQSTKACEDKELHIECEVGYIINVIRANYGRSSTDICTRSGITESSVNCRSEKSRQVLNGRCNGKRSCNVAASNSVFGDPCVGTYKYLEVDYVCDQPDIKTVDDFISIYNIEFQNETEKGIRRKIIKKNLENVEAHKNLYDTGQTGYRMGLNQYGYLTYEEFIRQLTGYDASFGAAIKHNKGTSYKPIDLPHVPHSLDLRNLVNPIRNQGRHCSSCWAFSTTCVIESQIKKEKGVLQQLSEQYLIDCDRGSKFKHTHGCTGGWPAAAIRYVKKNGIALASGYNYTGYTETCNHATAKTTYSVVREQLIKNGSDADLMNANFHIGPISVSIYASPASQLYRSGVLDQDDDCTSGNPPNHAVVLVGYGTENGRDYWLIRNSWGTTWGEKGYWKLSRSEPNYCGISSHGVFPILEGPCVPNPCGINADCRADGDNPKCTCSSGYEGDPSSRCNPPGPCVPNPCGINANCHADGVHAICTCPSGYGGDPAYGCNPPGSCVPDPCGKNADCRADGDNPICTCSRGYEGDPSSGCNPPGPCVPNPCGINANCHADGVHAICTCPSGYEGDPAYGCNPHGPCVPDPCGINADCRADGDNPICTCSRGYEGDPSSGCNPPAAGCSDAEGFFKVPDSGNQCFKFFPDSRRSWYASKLKCEEEGLLLAKIDDPVPLRTFLLEAYGDNKQAWIGGHGTGSDVEWIRDGTVLSSSNPAWFPGHPNPSTSSCLRLVARYNFLRSDPTKSYAMEACVYDGHFALCELVME